MKNCKLAEYEGKKRGACWGSSHPHSGTRSTSCSHTLTSRFSTCVHSIFDTTTTWKPKSATNYCHLGNKVAHIHANVPAHSQWRVGQGVQQLEGLKYGTICHISQSLKVTQFWYKENFWNLKLVVMKSYYRYWRVLIENLSQQIATSGPWNDTLHFKQHEKNDWATLLHQTVHSITCCIYILKKRWTFYMKFWGIH